VIALGPYVVGCATLVVAGLAKTRRPQDTARALGVLIPRLPLRMGGYGVRVAAGFEAVLGCVAMVEPRPVLAGGVAASYLAFAGYVAFARSRGGVLASCGCFGTPDTPATRTHVVVDLGLAAGAAAVAGAGPAGNLVTILGRQPLAGVPLLVLAGVGTALVIVTMTSLARLGSARALLSPRAAEGASRPPGP